MEYGSAGDQTKGGVPGEQKGGPAVGDSVGDSVGAGVGDSVGDSTHGDAQILKKTPNGAQITFWEIWPGGAQRHALGWSDFP